MFKKQGTRDIAIADVEPSDLERMNAVREALVELPFDQRMHVMMAVSAGTVETTGHNIEAVGERDGIKFTFIVKAELV